LQITSIAKTGASELTLAWNAVVGNFYKLRYSTNITSTNWVALPGEFSAAKTNVAVKAALNTNAPIGFYRVTEVNLGGGF